MKNLLNINVSIYKNAFDNEGKQVNLLTFLQSDRHKDAVLKLRAVEDKEQRNDLKKQLPGVTISGIFSPTRKAENLIQHSGLICLDIDEQDNLHIKNFADLKDQLRHIKEVAYCSHSAGGLGYFVIIPLKYPALHSQQFLALQRDFLRYGIQIDKNCKDVCRLRGYSFDEHPYINPNAKPYEGILKPEPRRITYNYDDPDETMQRVSTLCRQIDSNHIDLTSDYGSWFQVCASLASLGEHGRDYFHLVSRQNDKYRETESDKKFDNLLKSGQKIGIGTFFETCKQNGIYFKN